MKYYKIKTTGDYRNVPSDILEFKLINYSEIPKTSCFVEENHTMVEYPVKGFRYCNYLEDTYIREDCIVDFIESHEGINKFPSPYERIANLLRIYFREYKLKQILENS